MSSRCAHLAALCLAAVLCSASSRRASAQAGPVPLEAVEDALLAGGEGSHSGRAVAIDAEGLHTLVASREGVDAYVRTAEGWQLASRWRPLEPLETGVGALAIDPSGEIGVAGVHAQSAPFVVVLGRGELEWSRVAVLQAHDLGSNSGFGLAVSVSDHGDRIAIGAPLAEGGRGLVIVLRREGTHWAEEWRGRCPGGDTRERAGTSVALDARGERLVLGAPLAHGAMGRACVILREGTTWGGAAVLDPRDLGRGARFGSAVAIDDETVVVGAPRDRTEAWGSVHVFERADGRWSRSARIPGELYVRLDHGGSLAVAEGRIAIGSNDGAILTTTRGTERVVLEPVRAGAESFGRSVALSADARHVLIGAPEDDLEDAEDAGTVALYRLSGRDARDLPPSPRLASMDPSRAFLHTMRARARRGALADRIGAQLAVGALLVGSATAAQVSLLLDARPCTSGSCTMSSGDARDVLLGLTPTLFVLATMATTQLVGDSLGGHGNVWVELLAGALGAAVAATLVYSGSSFDPPVSTTEGVAFRVGGHVGAGLLVLGACVLAYGLADDASRTRFDAPDLVPVIRADPTSASVGLAGRF